MGKPNDYELNYLDQLFAEQEAEREQEYEQLGDCCPACKNDWCEEVAAKNGVDMDECPTYYDGCHCCVLCHGFPRCEHGLWDSEDCAECDKE